MRPLLRPLARAPRRAHVARQPARRTLHLAPPFLLEDYQPRYSLLSSVDASKKRSKAYAHLANCNLCPRECGVNRFEKTGMCLVGEKAKVNVIAPHFGEGGFSLPPVLSFWWGKKPAECYSLFGVVCVALLAWAVSRTGGGYLSLRGQWGPEWDPRAPREEGRCS